MTDPTGLSTDEEVALARWIANLGGWIDDLPFVLTDEERQVTSNWVDAGLLRRSSEKRGDILKFTPAGWEWCREHGIDRPTPA